MQRRPASTVEVAGADCGGRDVRILFQPAGLPGLDRRIAGADLVAAAVAGGVLILSQP